MMKNIYERINSIYKSKIIILGVYFSVIVLFLTNPLNSLRNSVSNFKRTFGIGIANNWDASKVIRNYYIWFVIFVLLFLFFSYITKKVEIKIINKEDNIAWKHIDTVLPIACIGAIINMFSYYFRKGNSASGLSLAVCAITICIILDYFYIIFRISKSLSYSAYKKLLLIITYCSFILSILFYGYWKNGLGWIISYIIIYVFCIFIIKLFNLKVLNHSVKKLVDCLSCMSIIFGITSIYLEVVNVLNQYNIFIHQPKKIYYICSFLLFSMLFLNLKQNKIWTKKLVKWIEKNTYFIVIIGLAALAVQLPLQWIGQYDIFESANYSILISDFLSYGKIPLVEHYGGHMLSQVVSGILYGIINADIAGAAYSPYSIYIYIVLIGLFYKTIEKLVGGERAFWFTLTIPFYSYWSYYGIGFIICFSIIRYLKEKTYKNVFFIWISCILVVLYRLDVGVAFGIGTVITLILYCIIYDKKEVKRIFISFGVVVISGVIAWCLLCIAKDINPIERLIEFINISSSNLNWSYASTGDFSKISFSWYYFCIPIVIIMSLLLLTLVKSIRNNMSIYVWCSLLVLGISYISNFSRSLVRHSAVEMLTEIMVFTAYIFIAIFVSNWLKSKVVFIYIFSTLIFINTLFTQDTIMQDNSLLNQAAQQSSNFIDLWSEKTNGTTYWQKISNRVERVQMPETLNKIQEPLNEVFTKLLSKDETFIDFTNQTFLYSSLGKECPVYVSQSPGQLSGQKTQESFIQQIQSNIDNIPLVLMPSTLSKGLICQLDGIANSYRYYKVAEFIYQKYQPLCDFNDFSIWCLKENYDDYKKKLEQDQVMVDINNIFESTIATNDTTISIHDDSIEVSSIGIDPYIYNLEELCGIKDENTKKYNIVLEYSSTENGLAQLFFTNLPDEEFNEEKSVSLQTFENGSISFTCDLNSLSMIRLDVPANSKFTIHSMKISEGSYKLIDYGYDDLEQVQFIHTSPLYKLPYIWANYDELKAYNNEVISNLELTNDGVYLFEVEHNKLRKEKGNYLLVSCDYIEGEGQSTEAILYLGTYNEAFDSKYQYSFQLEKGHNQYLIRISTDYHWYADDINAVKLYTNGGLSNISMKLLIGD